jgi:hypothetical protein
MGIAAASVVLGTLAAPTSAFAATMHDNTTKVAYESATTLKSIAVNKAESFTVTIKDSHKKAISGAVVSFTSGNTSVATVSSSHVVTNKYGQAKVVITGHKAGSTTLKVTVNGLSRSYKITVTAPPAPKVSISGITDGQTVTSASQIVTVNSNEKSVSLYLNGKRQSGTGPTFHVTLVPGENTITAEATNGIQTTKQSIHVTYNAVHVFPPSLTDSVNLPTVGTDVPNQAENDLTYWQRASEDFYVMAETDNPADPGNTQSNAPAIVNLQVGQTVDLTAYDNNTDVPQSQCKWLVNSPDASITPSSLTFTMGGYEVAVANFVAHKPGIYTIQAEAGGRYSVPLVLIVGLSDLRGKVPQADAADSGVLPLPAGLLSGSRTEGTDVDYEVGTPIDGWIPVSGVAHKRSGMMTIVLYSGDQTWLYNLPEQSDGTFSALVRSPFSGTVTVGFIPNFFESLNESGSLSWDSEVTLAVPSPAPSTQHTALLASALRDYNVQSPFATVAEELAAASPSIDTAIAAISNFVSEDIAYNYTAFYANDVPWQDAITTWNTHLGVCQDMANLAAAMLETIGIPTQTVSGTADNGAHEWDQAWDGRQWLVFDPTWDAPDEGIITMLTNEFLTNTTSLQSTHVIDSTSVGSAFHPVVAAR